MIIKKGSIHAAAVAPGDVILLIPCELHRAAPSQPKKIHFGQCFMFCPPQAEVDCIFTVSWIE